MTTLIRAVLIACTAVAGILTPAVLNAPDAPEAQPKATVIITTPTSTVPQLDGDPPQLRVYVKPSDDERLAMDALEPLLVAKAREDHGHCGEFYDEAMSVGWQPSEWKKLRGIIARETGNTCDPGVLNDSHQTRDLSYGLLQINMRGKLGPDRVARCGLTSYEDLWDPTTNLACGRVLYLLAGWAPWAYTPK